MVLNAVLCLKIHSQVHNEDLLLFVFAFLPLPPRNTNCTAHKHACASHEPLENVLFRVHVPKGADGDDTCPYLLPFPLPLSWVRGGCLMGVTAKLRVGGRCCMWGI